ncbi:hypothetical protein [Antribacter gilvus]|uniref:hypothetical protein n=1 Tax=Antribacter gilvus TaxID=2304675 RepID=UPI000F79A452|nr:hypothetical protein [Antribacter gilvus]
MPTTPEPAQEAPPQPRRNEPAPEGEARNLSATSPKISRSFKFDEEQILRAETAVLRTSAFDGGYRSMAALMNSALARELERLAREFNDGEPFPPNTGEYRTGRPIGR